MRLAALVVLLAACDVGSVGPGGDGTTPDASGGGGSGSGSGSGGQPQAQTLRVTYTTQPANGIYMPAHVIAVWVEDAAGTFVKTIDRWSDIRTGSLIAWSRKSNVDADAISGATKTVHGEITATWDLTDRQNAVIADGTYTVRMELADTNATAPGQNNQGTFTFTKGAAPETQSGLSNGNFTNVSLVFTP